jgi:hypothetical protein
MLKKFANKIPDLVYDNVYDPEVTRGKKTRELIPLEQYLSGLK